MEKLKIFTIILCIVEILTIFAFLFIFQRAGYDVKLLEKLGLRKPQLKTNWASIGWSNCLEKLDYDSDIVFLGDSIIRGSDFQKYFPNKKIVNLGCAGDTIQHLIQRADSVCATSPEKIFIMGGINSLKDNNVKKIISEYYDLLDIIISKNPNAKIYVQSVLPISKEQSKNICKRETIIEFNIELKKICSNKNIFFIDIYSLYQQDGYINPTMSKDGVHINDEAYSLWAKELEKYIL